MDFHVIWNVAYYLDYLFVIYNFCITIRSHVKYYYILIMQNILHTQLHIHIYICVCVRVCMWFMWNITSYSIISIQLISKYLKITPNLFLTFNDFRKKLITKTSLNFLVKKFCSYLLIPLISKIIVCNITHIYNTCTYTRSCYAFTIWCCFVFQRISKNPTT